MVKMFSFKASTAVALFVAAGANAVSYLCHCELGQPCWPTTQNWAFLNSSIGGNLVTVLPVASPCHDPYYNAAACAIVQANTHSSPYRSAQPGMFYFALTVRESCQ
jgi:hypothetical protein